MPFAHTMPVIACSQTRRFAILGHWLLLAALLAGLGAAAPACAASTAPLALDDASPLIQAWPAVTVLSDPGKQLTLTEVRAAAAQFAAPTTASATLGHRKDAVWLRLPLAVSASSDGRWLLDIDYPLLNRIDVYLVDAGGQLVQQALLGNQQPFQQRPVRSRSHALELLLTPAASYELWLRIETLGGMIVPITLNKPTEFLQRALGEQMLQGLLAGLGLCLLLYSLGQWVILREALFLKYMVLTFGSLMFSVVQFGIGAQFLWTDNLWLEQHVAGLMALTAAAGTFLFVEQALSGTRNYRHFGRLMKSGAELLCVVGVAYALDLIDVHVVSAVIGTVGLAPALLGLPGAVTLARRGDSVGWYFLVAWLAYFVCTFAMVALIKGYLPANAWTLHSFQIGATLDMLLFLRVLGLRMQAMHTAARRATLERDELMSMALTDALTGLPNRRGLNAALSHGLTQCSPSRMLAVYVLDLDDFKLVNDRFGHDVGDELLVAVTLRLQATLRASDVVARLGGDEFVVLASGLHHTQQAEDLGAQLVQAFQQPIELRQQQCRIGLTIGYALAPHDGADPSTLLKRADAAMYEGKQSGKLCLRRGEVAAT